VASQTHDAVVRESLVKRRLVVVEDAVQGEHYRRPKDVVEAGVDRQEIVIFSAGGWLAAKSVAEELGGT
jgi:hypothetical protein